LDFLRNDAGITSAKDGCSGQGACGACLVELNGRPALAESSLSFFTISASITVPILIFMPGILPFESGPGSFPVPQIVKYKTPSRMSRQYLFF